MNIKTPKLHRQGIAHNGYVTIDSQFDSIHHETNVASDKESIADKLHGYANKVLKRKDPAAPETTGIHLIGFFFVRLNSAFNSQYNQIIIQWQIKITVCQFSSMVNQRKTEVF